MRRGPRACLEAGARVRQFHRNGKGGEVFRIARAIPPRSFFVMCRDAMRARWGILSSAGPGRRHARLFFAPDGIGRQKRVEKILIDPGSRLYYRTCRTARRGSVAR